MKKIFVGLLFFLVVLIGIGDVSATDWTFTNVTGIGFTNDPSFTFMVTNNNAAPSGEIDNLFLGDGGYFSSAARITGCDNCLYGMVNPIDNTVWGTDEQGNIFYTDQQYGNVNYALGWYNYPGNTNPLYRVGVVTPNNKNQKLAFDSSGNVYTVDAAGSQGRIYKYVKSLGYSAQLVHTLNTVEIYGHIPFASALGIQIGSNNRIYLLVAAYSGGQRCIEYVTIDAGGNLVSDYPLETCSAADSYIGGGLILDSTNPDTNYTYGYITMNGATTLNHHNITTPLDGATQISPLTGLTSVSDISYNNYQIYVSSPSQNLIRSYVTNYQGYGYSLGSTPNPDSITGTFSWLDGYQNTVSTITPGSALAYKWTISNNDLKNYTFYSGWGSDAKTEPAKLQELKNLNGLGIPAVFNTPSDSLAGTSIYGYILSKRNNDSFWYLLATPTKLTISPSVAGYDSITLNKAFYNLTADTVTATFTYSSGFPPWAYEWEICSRVDCADGNIFNPASLLGQPATSSMVTTGMNAGNYYAVLLRHLPFLGNEIKASQLFQIRPPVISVAWDKQTYNLLPKSITTNTCLDSTPSTSYFTNITGYGGLKYGIFSCPSVPGFANANNSIMRASFFSKYSGTFYLNNSLGTVWNGTLSNGSASLLYVLTNTSPTELWTLTGINESGEIFPTAAQVSPENVFGYSIKIDKAIAFNTNTLFLTFHRPIQNVDSFVLLKDASGTTIATWTSSDTSGSYYIDPTKQYSYGIWTAYWDLGAFGVCTNTKGCVATVDVRNSAPPISNASTIPIGGTRTGGTLDTCSFFDNWVQMMFGQINGITRFGFALLIISIVLVFCGIGMKSLGAGVVCAFFPYVFFVFLSLASPCGEYMPVWTAVFIALIIGIKLKWF